MLVSKLSDPTLEDHNLPTKEGTIKVEEDDQFLIIPDGHTDLWRHTYYSPPLVADNSYFRVCWVRDSEAFTVTTTFVLKAAAQFDQGGILVRLDSEYWIKAGVEVVDDVPMLSCVVTNKFSDWSTQVYDKTISLKSENNDSSNTTVHLRLHKLGTSYAIESRKADDEKWEFFRICHLASEETQDKKNEMCGLGFYCCAPTNQQGCQVQVLHFTIVEGSEFNHEAS